MLMDYGKQYQLIWQHWCCNEWVPVFSIPIGDEIEIEFYICVEFELILHWNPLPHSFTCS